MIIYWSMILIIVIFAFIGQNARNKNLLEKYGSSYQSFTILIPVLYIVFWTGIRDRFVDTSAYIENYQNIPLGNFAIIKDYVSSVENDKGFYLYSVLFKNYISTNYHWWLFSIALISGICIYRVIRKYSTHPHFSLYLFMTMCIFSWMMNGIRQFLAICILFCFSDWLFEKKWKYIVLILLVSTIHSSAIYILPFVLIACISKIWDKKMFFFIAAMLVLITFAERIMPALISSFATEYSSTFADNAGSGVMRSLVAFVPVVLSFIKRDRIRQENNKYMNLCVNMSIISACIYALASVSNGILIGRMPMYFQVYNLVLMPWLITKCFSGRTRELLVFSCVCCYLFYFIYQTYFAGNFYYSSEITGFIA